MVDAGWIGEVTAMTFAVNVTTDWAPWPWLARSDRLEIMYHSIHYLDAIRAVLGEPARVFCTGSRTPGQVAAGETRTISTLVYPGNARGLVHATHENRTGDPEATFRIDGAEGSIKGTLGLLYDYPHGRPDTLEVSSRVVPTDGWLAYPVTSRWIPTRSPGRWGRCCGPSPPVAGRTPRPRTIWVPSDWSMRSIRRWIRGRACPSIERLR
jgi:predicted dehydrogenase